MKIAIIGAGFTGLSAAYELTKKGHRVYVFEKDSQPGGLALGFKEDNWEWSLEKHYHHWFTNDKFVLNLAKEIEHEVIIKRPKTSVLVNDGIYQFDSPKEVLLFPKLPMLDKIRMGLVIGFLKFNPFWKPLEKLNAATFLPLAMGRKGFEMIWLPLFNNKFGDFAKDISLSWFWARIVKRTPSLAYPAGGFLSFANHMVEILKEKGSTFFFDSEIIELSSLKNPSLKVKLKNKTQKFEFDRVIVTLPSFMFFKISPDLPQAYKDKFARLKGLGATNLLLRLNKPFLKDGSYWVSVCDKDSPIMAIVEHTNFMDKKHYDNEHLVYLGNYLPPESFRFGMEKQEVLELFKPFLKKIDSDFEKNLIGYQFFKAPFAQPIIPRNYSRMIPPMETPFKNVFLANIEQVYPWDRGTNYAVELGQKVAELVKNV
jgi:protoporphyrinogen oxidase